MYYCDWLVVRRTARQPDMRLPVRLHSLLLPSSAPRAASCRSLQARFRRLRGGTQTPASARPCNRWLVQQY